MNEKEEIYQQLSAYIDGELSEDEARLLEEMLHRSPEIAEELKSLRRVQRLVRELPFERAPEGLTEKVLAQRDRKTHARLFVTGRFRQLAWAAGILLAIGVGLVITHLTTRPVGTDRVRKTAQPLREKRGVSGISATPAKMLAASELVPHEHGAVTNISINTDNLTLTQKQIEGVFIRNRIKPADSAKASVSVRTARKADRTNQPVNIFKRTVVKRNQIRYEVVITQEQLKDIITEINAIRASQHVAQLPPFRPGGAGGSAKTITIARAKAPGGKPEATEGKIGLPPQASTSSRDVAVARASSRSTIKRKAAVYEYETTPTSKPSPRRGYTPTSPMIVARRKGEKKHEIASAAKTTKAPAATTRLAGTSESIVKKHRFAQLVVILTGIKR